MQPSPIHQKHDIRLVTCLAVLIFLMGCGGGGGGGEDQKETVPTQSLIWNQANWNEAQWE